MPFNIYQLYIDLLNNIELYSSSSDKEYIENLRSIARFTIGQLDKNIIGYEDVAPIVYLKSVLDHDSNKKSIKHVIIDEAPNY